MLSHLQNRLKWRLSPAIGITVSDSLWMGEVHMRIYLVNVLSLSPFELDLAQWNVC